MMRERDAIGLLGRAHSAGVFQRVAFMGDFLELGRHFRLGHVDLVFRVVKGPVFGGGLRVNLALSHAFL